MDETITANLRVVGCQIKDAVESLKTGERLHVKAEGTWRSEGEGCNRQDYAISVHFLAYPGCGAVPVIGDDIEITIKRPVYVPQEPPEHVYR